jgi:hypothetical protein
MPTAPPPAFCSRLTVSGLQLAVSGLRFISPLWLTARPADKMGLMGPIGLIWRLKVVTALRMNCKPPTANGRRQTLLP